MDEDMIEHEATRDEAREDDFDDAEDDFGDEDDDGLDRYDEPDVDPFELYSESMYDRDYDF